MSLNESLAVLRMRQWSADKDRTRRGMIARYRHCGWTPRDERMHDARLVRLLDFERTFAVLPPHQQALLLLAYRDGLSAAAASRTLRQPEAEAQRALAAARQALANALDRRCLL